MQGCRLFHRFGCGKDCFVNNNAKIKQVIQALKQKCEADDRILAAYLHGSFGTKTFRPDSDVDCALMLHPGQTLTARERLQWSGDLAGELGLPVDLGLLTHQNLIYFMQAVSQGIRIYCRDETKTDALVALGYSLYARLKEDRRMVEEAYRAA